MDTDAIRSAYAADRRSAGLERAAVAGIVADQLLESFGHCAPLSEPYVRAAVRAAPLAILKPNASSFWTDPRLWGVVGVVGVLVAGQAAEQ